MFSIGLIAIVIVVSIQIIVICLAKTYVPCPFDQRCNCWTDTTSLLHVTCARGNLSVIPNFPSNIITIDLSHNCIQTIPSRTFEKLGNLTDLNLSWNNLTHLEPEAFVGLHNLQRLILQNNLLKYNLQSFPKNIFKPLISLTHFNVKFNNLLNFPDEMVSDLTKVDTFALLGAMPFGKAFSVLTNLRNLTTGFCIIPNLNSSIFSNIRYLEFIDISECNIQTYTPCIFCDKNIKYLDISNTDYEFNAVEIFKMMKDLSPSIEILIMKNTFHSASTLPSRFFSFLSRTRIRELRISNNMFVETIGDTRLPSTLRNLDFSDNRLVKFCFQMPKLLRLYLRNNSLGIFLASNSYTNFKETVLEHVDLSFNGIYHLPFSIFHGHLRIETINLSNNVLSDITFDLSHAPKLRMLDLSSNNITSITNQSTMVTIGNLLKRSDLKIDLSNNTLRCSCQATIFMQWMLSNQQHFYKIHEYRCKQDNGNIIVLNRFEETVLRLKKECASYTVLYILISIATATIFTILLAGLIYGYRWKVRYMYYMTKSKYSRIKPIDTIGERTYNAFISYSEHDQDFILKECIPNLEEKGDMKLCINDRDFLPGEEITVNITNAIHESKKTVCVITRSFLDSYYCMFEFNMARMESIYSRNGQNILFLVRYERLLPRDLPLVMLELIQQQSYAEYTNDEQGYVVFWEKIKQAIE